MRIIAGKFKGNTLYGPTNTKIRPLKDMVRESIFNFLIHSNKILFQLEQSNVLDLYSGIGSFGLECLSRQSSKVVFVEKEKKAVKILEKNIEKLGEKSKTRIFVNNIFGATEKVNKYNYAWITDLKYDLIFCDPPFKDTNINKLIELIIVKNLIKKNGIIILHRHKDAKEKLANSFKIIDERVYGRSKIIFGQPVLTSS
jgi:16S rRNA (guanine966-N2)-methyltransferase